MTAEKKYIDAGVILLLAALALLFFLGAILDGQVVNGIDDNYANRQVDAQIIAESGTSVWRDSYWLGRGYSLPFNTKYLFRANLPMRWELTANLAATIGLALTFSFLFLRRLGLGRMPSAFGAIAYGFAPHYITLIYPCHIDAIVGAAYAPMLFYFLTLAFNAPGLRTPHKWAAAAVAGAAWGMLMNEDPQRGLYFSVAAVAYVSTMVFDRGSGEKSGAAFSRERLLPLLRLAPIALFFLGTFYNNLNFYLGGRNVGGQTVNTYDQGLDQRWEFATSWSLYPAELTDSIAPGYHGNITGDEDKPYWGLRPVAHSSDSLGFFVVLFGFAGFLAGFRRERWIRFFTITAILATLLAFGRYWPGKPLFWLWYNIPLMDLFRAPSKFMAVTAFALAILSAFGLQYLLESLRDDSKMSRYMQRATLALVGFGIFWTLYLLFNELGMKSKTIMVFGGDTELAQTAFENSIIAVLRMLLCAATAFIIIFSARRLKEIPLRIQATGYIFTLALIVDLFTIGQFYLGKSLFDPDEFFVEDEVVSHLLGSEAPARVATALNIDFEGQTIPLPVSAVGNAYLNYIFPYYGIESIDSPPTARVDRDYADFFAGVIKPFPLAADPDDALAGLVENNLRFWRLCNVKYLVTDGFMYSGLQRPIPIIDQLSDSPGLEYIGAFEGFFGRRQTIFRVNDALPRFAIYDKTTVVDEADQIPQLLGDEDFDLSATAIIASAHASEKHFDGDAPLRQPTILERRRDYARLRVETERPSLLVMNSRYDERWSVSVNGSPVPVVPANSIMLGVPLPTGEQIVEISFQAESGAFRISGASVAAAILTALALLTVGLLSPCSRRAKGVDTAQ